MSQGLSLFDKSLVFLSFTPVISTVVCLSSGEWDHGINFNYIRTSTSSFAEKSAIYTTKRALNGPMWLPFFRTWRKFSKVPIPNVQFTFFKTSNLIVRGEASFIIYISAERNQLCWNHNDSMAQLHVTK